MNWYYASGSERLGPVDQAAFQRLAAEGVIVDSTLVWHEGLVDWLRFADTEPVKFCTECGKPSGMGLMMPYGTSWICASCKPRFLQKVREGVLSVSAMPYAGFWIRFGARMIDGVIMWVVNMFVNFFLAAFLGVRLTSPTGVWTYLGTIYSFQFALGVAYETIFVWKYGGTPGKLILGLKIVRADGGDLGFGLALGRYAAAMVTNFTIGIGYVMAAIDDEKRALHDRLCNTRVIKPQ